jgi:hypothetical protein|tara:strand:+ start:5508 stop:6215 length:708 start_codon:yes stop_codon:yes gene_type:complete
MERTIDNKIDQWFEDRGIVANGKTMSQAIKTLEETTELIDAINTNNLLEIVDAVGDIYVTLRGVCVVQGIDLEDCAKLAYNEIKDRKGHLRADGTFVKEHDRLPEKLLHNESYARIDIIGQNGNDGLHYTPGPGPLDGKSAQRQFDEVAEAIDSYQHDASYYDTERNKPFEGLYERSIKERHGRAVLTVSELMQEELEPIPDVTYSTDVKERAVWRDSSNDPKIISFKEDSKDVD